MCFSLCPLYPPRRKRCKSSQETCSLGALPTPSESLSILGAPTSWPYRLTRLDFIPKSSLHRKVSMPQYNPSTKWGAVCSGREGLVCGQHLDVQAGQSHMSQASRGAGQSLERQEGVGQGACLPRSPHSGTRFQVVMELHLSRMIKHMLFNTSLVWLELRYLDMRHSFLILSLTPEMLALGLLWSIIKQKGLSFV